jgi:hypothetical protein
LFAESAVSYHLWLKFELAKVMVCFVAKIRGYGFVSLYVTQGDGCKIVNIN